MSKREKLKMIFEGRRRQLREAADKINEARKGVPVKDWYKLPHFNYGDVVWKYTRARKAWRAIRGYY